jgi:hypothetical protein
MPPLLICETVVSQACFPLHRWLDGVTVRVPLRARKEIAPLFASPRGGQKTICESLAGDVLDPW